MAKSEKFEAPAMHTRAATEDKKEYYFRNRKMPGQSFGCHMGNAPVKGSGESAYETVNKFYAKDGDVVKLTESEAEHLRSKGVQKPIVEEGPGGEKTFTGRYYLDRRFDLERV